MRSTPLQLSVSDSSNLSNGPGDCAFSYFFYGEKKLQGLLLGSNYYSQPHSMNRKNSVRPGISVSVG